jgi:general secretion pathway protein G
MQKQRQPNRRSLGRVVETQLFKMTSSRQPRGSRLVSTGRRRGFTLIEVLLVVAILGVIAAAVVPALIGRQQEANIQITRTDIRGLETALKMYAIDHDGEYLQGSKDALPQLTSPSEYRGKKTKPYLEEIPKDAWGEPLFYEYPSSKGTKGEKPAIWSSGPNRQNEEGAGDDINNWTDQ